MEAVTPATEQPKQPEPATFAGAEPTPVAPTMPRLIATDLDGTLLRDDKSVSERTVAALAAAEAAGIDVFFVTGRPARWMNVVSDHLHGHGLAICANGAAVVDLHQGIRFVLVRPLLAEDARAVVRALRAVAPGTAFAVERTGGIHHEPGYPPLSFDTPTTIGPVDKLLSEDADQAEQPILKLLAHHPDLVPDDFLDLARTSAGQHATFTRSSPSALLEISGLGVSKASTLERCCAERGITRDQVMAFGDMPNDVEMLNWAGMSYAMANAHPEVLAATSRHAPGNNEDGVATVIESVLGR
ncbi:Cof-type HAD-IIB family hydrolase [Streptomyces sp. NPDC057702]|uniref:Cof-type HAD-IIB family hydrolase n=1 Tax=unclassified Streptomyces TaxID=2593676 RepID=UPI003678F038